MDCYLKVIININKNIPVLKFFFFFVSLQIKGENIIVSRSIGHKFKNGVPILAELQEKVCIMPLVKMMESIFHCQIFWNQIQTTLKIGMM